MLTGPDVASNWSGREAFREAIRGRVGLLTGLTVLVLTGGAAPGTAAEIVYQDMLPGLESRYAGLDAGGRPTEFGDEVSLAGTSRLVTRFIFEYYGDFVDLGNKTARVRFYANDGPGPALKPRTVLWDSGPIIIPKTAPTSRAEVRLNVSNVEVPNSFTWTMEFSGLTQLPGDRAELIVIDPPTIGGILADGKIGSYSDCWKKNAGDWETVLGPVPLNFACQVEAVPEILTPVVSRQSNPSAARVEWIGRVNGVYSVRGSPDSATWYEVGQHKVDATGLGRVTHTPPNGVLFTAYRVYRLYLPPAAARMSVRPVGGSRKYGVGVSGEPYRLYQLKYTQDFKTWFYLATLETGAAGVGQYIDHPPAVGSPRFYRVWTPW
jgi:hypothetical protein